MGYMTELGKKTYALVCNFNLGEWYDPMSGHILIAKEDINATILASVNIFLFNNTDWCMGYEENCMYIVPIEDLQQ